ncbi:MAG: type II secretion system protein [Nitrospinae bacterium]|nr:type II secretion system protein [Nitrospinota bacterium]
MTRALLRFPSLRGASSVTARGGFTLIEMLVVVVIIGIMAGALIPRLPDVTASRLKSSARRLAGTITYLYERSAATQLVYRLTLDMDSNEFYVSLLNKDNQFEETKLDFASRTHLPDNVRVDSANISAQGAVSSGRADIHFFPGGFTDQAYVYLKDSSGNELTLDVHPLTGRVRILEGRHAARRAA